MFPEVPVSLCSIPSCLQIRFGFLGVLELYQRMIIMLLDLDVVLGMSTYVSHCFICFDIISISHIVFGLGGPCPPTL